MALNALSKQGRGTHPLGIYRALSLKLKETSGTLTVKYNALEAKELFALNVPAIINGGLLHQPRTELENELMAQFQWEPGVVHSVVFLSRNGDRVQVADPDFGIETWHVDEFVALYNGTALWIE